MFIDEATLRVSGGKGGNGCCAFRHEKFAPRGGPYGGNGGHGGSVYLRANPNLYTLLDIPARVLYHAQDGEAGRGKKQTGANGSDCIVEVPLGTIVCDAATGMVLRDLTQPNETVRVAAGGRGGRGNASFASATNRSPRTCERGEHRTLPSPLATRLRLSSASATSVAAVVTAVAAAAYTAPYHGGGAHHRSGARHRPSDHARSSASSSEWHLRLLRSQRRRPLR